MLASIAALSLAHSLFGNTPAKEPSPQELTLAREQFKIGVTAAKDGRWEDARSAFERSYELASHPQILFNLAAAEAQTGRLVKAAESYRRFLREPTNPFVEEHKKEVEQFLGKLVRRIPRVVIRVDGLGSSDGLYQDGAVVSTAVIGVPLPIDPGLHVFTVARGGHELARREVSLREGETRDLHLTLPAQVARNEVPVADISEIAPIEAPEAEPSDRSDLPTTLLWLAIGTAVVGGTIALGFAVGGDRDVYRGTTQIVARGIMEP